MWAAIRYRRTQALVLVLLSALITACAVFAPLYERALEQALLRNLVDTAHPADTALVVRAGRTASRPDLVPAALDAVVSEEVRRLHGRGIGMIYGRMDVVPERGLKPSPSELIARDDACEHLRLTVGSCPASAGEVLVSAKDLERWGWRVGQTFTTPITGVPDGTAVPVLTVSGAYEVVPDDAYWLRTQVDGKSGTMLFVGLEQVPALDAFLTTPATFGPDWSAAQLTKSYPARRDLITLDTLPSLAEALGDQRGQELGAGGAVIDSPLPALVGQLRSAQQQVRVIVPLLMAQLGLLAGAVLLLVAQAAVEQRRPEVALARLRGRSRDGAGRIVMAELGLTVALGLPVGVALAFVASEVVRRAVLPAGVPFEVPWLTYAAVGASALVCAAAIWVAARPVQRQTISTLLRRVAPTGRRGWAVVDVLAVALAAFGVIGLATRSLEGPLALVTPTLIALAAGLVASRLAVPVAAAAGRASLAAGRVGPALTAFALERRPALRKVVTVVSVAAALAVFAANAVLVADRNRAARAQLEAGAPVVLATDTRQPGRLLAALEEVDPSGRLATPVAVMRPADVGAPPTMAVLADGFEAVSYPPPGADGLRLSALRAPEVEPVMLRGRTVTGRLDWSFPDLPERTPPGGVPGQSGAPFDQPLPLLDPTPSELRLAVTLPNGQRVTRMLALVPLTQGGTLSLSAPLLCPDGCRLDALEFRKTDAPTSVVEGTLRLTGFGLDGRALDLARAEEWVATQPDAGDGEERHGIAVDAGASGNGVLTLALRNTGVVDRLTHADVPAVLPALLAGPVPPGGDAASFPVVSLNGGQVNVRVSQQVESLPELGASGVLVDFRTLARLGGTIPDRARLSVWLADADPGHRQRVEAALAEQGIGVASVRTYEDAKAAFDESASGWGLRLALFTGAAALLMAALVLVVVAVTSWRVVARDLAALRLVGVPVAALRRSLLREQVTLVLVGVGVGVVCGALASFLAMPLIPLFDVPAAVPRLDLAPSWPAIAAATLVSLLVLAAVGAAVAVAVGRQVALRRVQESL